ncbi:hypothetical protein LDL08_28630 [Nonomuraea glycinis]|nr:hypothetical protein [Nonomuraea glycinis]
MTTVFTNTAASPATNVRVTLAVPPGWTARPHGSPGATRVRPRGELTVRWTLRPPSGTARPGGHPVRAFARYGSPGRPKQVSSTYGRFLVPLDLAAFPQVDAADAFGADTSASYTAYQPSGGEAKPAIAVGDGRLAATGATPYFALMAGPAPLPPGDAVSVLTAGSFAGHGRPEDSVFVGWVKDASTYVTAWYNHTRQMSGLNVSVNGHLLPLAGDAPLTLKPGDRFALLLSGTTITSYAESAGVWRELRTADLGDTLATPEARQGHRYGFGLRGSTGTITITAVEARRP